MRNMKFLAAAFALLFALSANVAPAMASSHDKDKSSKYEDQTKNQDKDKRGDKDRKKHKEDMKKDKNKADDRANKNMQKDDDDAEQPGQGKSKRWWNF